MHWLHLAGSHYPNGFSPNGKRGQDLACPRINNHHIIGFRVPDIDSRADGIGPYPVGALSHVDLFSNGECWRCGVDDDNLIETGDGDIGIGPCRAL